mmetsp:Transcript_138072/g.441106  ORF Transcript_138072/g.441106 Transcript_138072/m.441106 type:complete len:474 (-) Transcript_138072:1071-2492(-)
MAAAAVAKEDADLAAAFASLWTCPSGAATAAFAACGGDQPRPRCMAAGRGSIGAGNREHPKPQQGPEQEAAELLEVARWARARLGFGEVSFFRAVVTGDRRLAQEAAELLGQVGTDIQAAAAEYDSSSWWSRWMPWQRPAQGGACQLAAECAVLSHFSGLLRGAMLGASMQYFRAFFSIRLAFTGLCQNAGDVAGSAVSGYAHVGRAFIFLFLSLAPRMVQRIASVAGLRVDREGGLELLRSSVASCDELGTDSGEWAVVLCALWHLTSAQRMPWNTEGNRSQLLRSHDLLEGALAHLPESLILNWASCVVKQRLRDPNIGGRGGCPSLLCRTKNMYIQFHSASSSKLGCTPTTPAWRLCVPMFSSPGWDMFRRRCSKWRMCLSRARSCPTRVYTSPAWSSIAACSTSCSTSFSWQLLSSLRLWIRPRTSLPGAWAFFTSAFVKRAWASMQKPVRLGKHSHKCPPKDQWILCW